VEVRRVNDESPAAGAPMNTRWLSVQKYILSSKQLWEIWAIDERLLAKLEFFSLPSPMRNGRFIPLGFVSQVDEMLAKHTQEREKLVNDWCDGNEYEESIERARGELGEHFNLDDYPPIEVLRKSFTFSWQWVELGASNLLKEVNRDLWAREQVKAKEQWQDLTDDIKVVLRTNLNDLVASLIEKLSPSVDGKRRTFRANSMNAMEDFLKSFEVKNITDDEELQVVVEQLKQLTSGADVEMIKTDDAVRDNLKMNFAEVKTVLAEMIVDAPRRRVKF